MTKQIICVDLDGSLVYTDTLQEVILSAVKKNIFVLFSMLYWVLIKGRAYCKNRLAAVAHPDDFIFPVNKPLVLWLEDQKKLNTKLYLVTGQTQMIADAVAKQIPIFDGVFGSDTITNLTAKNKSDFLNQKFGKGNYIYVGNSTADLKVFPDAAQGVVISNRKKFIEKVKQLTDVIQVFASAENSVKQLIKALRLHQCAKNLLIFLPLLLARQFTQSHLLLTTLLGFIIFCFTASSAYLLNDLLDLNADRSHIKKQCRSFASGQLSPLIGIVTAFLLLAGSLLLSWLFLPIDFTLTLFIYYLLTLTYSFKLKQLLLIDVFALATFYVIRIFSGMTLLSAPYSFWLLLFSFFFFMSLAFMKRYSEIILQSEESKHVIAGRAYRSDHHQEIKLFGLCSGFSAVIIFTLYIQSSESALMYHHNTLLFLIFPLLLYWILRAWLLAIDGKMHDDPVVFALKDRVTYIIATLIFVLTLLAAI